jgi:hypothetical protein
MYNELENLFIEISESLKIEHSTLFIPFVEILSKEILKQKFPERLQNFKPIYNAFYHKLFQLIESEPFVDHLGKLREDLKLVKPNNEQVSNLDKITMQSLLFREADKSKVQSFNDLGCGSGSLSLKVMNHLRPNHQEMSLIDYVEAKVAYGKHHFVLIDKDPISIRCALIQIVLSHTAVKQNLPSELNYNLPRMELIVGDEEFKNAPHEVFFSNTKRDFYEIPVVRQQELYMPEIIALEATQAVIAQGHKIALQRQSEVKQKLDKCA